MKSTEIFDAPPLPDLKRVAGTYVLKVVFQRAGPSDRVAFGLAMNFIRLVEQAAQSYRLARQCMMEFANSKGELEWGRVETGCTQFELCVQCIHRSLGMAQTMVKYPNTPLGLMAFLPGDGKVLPDRLSEPIRKLRNASQHLNERLSNGEIGVGEPVAMLPGRNSLDLGKESVTYAQLVDAISMLHPIAAAVSNFRESAKR